MVIVNRHIGELIPYENNAKKHDKRQIANVAESIRQYGFVQPVVIDRDGVIVIGHCRVLAAKKLGMADVPCVLVEDLTPEQVNALRIVDNKTNESPWDLSMLSAELPELDLSGFEFDFNLPEIKEEPEEAAGNMELTEEDQKFMERMAAGEVSEEDEEYQVFVEKFKPKKTTDDCYTPQPVYEAVRNWCRKKYGIGESVRVVRPFYPGGDYTKEDYSGDCVVIDNPPFSILSSICEWYEKRGIRYFLFAPALTLLSTMSGRARYVAAGVSVTYANGANVSTSFVTNMGTDRAAAEPELKRLVQEANDAFLKENRKELPKYSYPDNVLASSMLSYLAIHGTEFHLSDNDAAFVRGLDAQKDKGKVLFGGGFLISEKAAAEKVAAEKAAAEKAAAEKWSLSPKEKDIISKLG